VRSISFGAEIRNYYAPGYSASLVAATIDDAALIATFGGSGHDSYDYFIPGDQQVRVCGADGGHIARAIHRSPVAAIAIGELRGGPVVVAGDLEGAVVVWTFGAQEPIHRIQLASRVTGLRIAGPARSWLAPNSAPP
jgi:hypothetical protein